MAVNGILWNHCILICLSVLSIFGGNFEKNYENIMEVPHISIVDQINEEYEGQDGDEEWFDEEFQELDRTLSQKQEISFSKVYDYLKSGDIGALCSYVLQGIGDSLYYEIKENHAIMVQLLAIIIIGTIFSNLSGHFGSYVEGNGFFITYLILVSLLLGTFTLVNEIAVETVENITEFMTVYIPAYAVATGYSNGQNTAQMSYEIVIIAIYFCENILCKIVFPIIKCSGIIALINRMNSEDYFSKTVGLMRSAASWIMKTMLAILTGLNLIKGMISPSLDKLERNGFIKLVSVLPGGTAAESVADILLGSGMLIKNCIGIAGAVVLLAISILPVVKIAVMLVSLKVVAALVQPLTDKRFSDGVHAMAVTISLMLKGIWTAVFLFVVSISMMSLLTK